MQAIETHDHSAIADPRMEGKYSEDALIMMAEVARMCLHPVGAARPEMAEVARRLSEIQDTLFRQNSGAFSQVDSMGSRDSRHQVPLVLLGLDSSQALSYDSRVQYEPMSVIIDGR